MQYFVNIASTFPYFFVSAVVRGVVKKRVRHIGRHFYEGNLIG